MGADIILAGLSIALAWKGIVEFGSLIVDFATDDSRERADLLHRLSVAQCVLIDWNNTYGCDRGASGLYNNFESIKKNLIMYAVIRLHEDREEALNILEKKYGTVSLSTSDGSRPEESESEAENGGERKSNRFKVALKRVDRLMRLSQARKRGSQKLRWLVLDEKILTKLVDNTCRMLKTLKLLTYGSPIFLAAGYAKMQQLEVTEWTSGLSAIEEDGRDRYKAARKGLAQPPNSPVGETAEEDELDQQTAVSFATSSIVSSAQATKIQATIGEAYDFHCDIRLSDRIREWWMDAASGFLLALTSEAPEDHSAAVACAVLFYLVRHQKLIYIFNAESEANALTQMADMIQTILHQTVVFGSDISKENLTLLPDLAAAICLEATPTQTLKQAALLLVKTLRDLLANSSARILLIINGLEDICVDDDTALLVGDLLGGLRDICETRNSAQPAFKIFLGAKGLAGTLISHMKDYEIVDLSDENNTELHLMQELAGCL